MQRITNFSLFFIFFLSMASPIAFASSTKSPADKVDESFKLFDQPYKNEELDKSLNDKKKRKECEDLAKELAERSAEVNKTGAKVSKASMKVSSGEQLDLDALMTDDEKKLMEECNKIKLEGIKGKEDQGSDTKSDSKKKIPAPTEEEFAELAREAGQNPKGLTKDQQSLLEAYKADPKYKDSYEKNYREGQWLQAASNSGKEAAKTGDLSTYGELTSPNQKEAYLKEALGVKELDPRIADAAKNNTLTTDQIKALKEVKPGDAEGIGRVLTPAAPQIPGADTTPSNDGNGQLGDFSTSSDGNNGMGMQPTGDSQSPFGSMGSGGQGGGTAGDSQSPFGNQQNPFAQTTCPNGTTLSYHNGQQVCLSNGSQCPEGYTASNSSSGGFFGGSNSGTVTCVSTGNTNECITYEGVSYCKNRTGGSCVISNNATYCTGSSSNGTCIKLDSKEYCTNYTGTECREVNSVRYCLPAGGTTENCTTIDAVKYCANVTTGSCITVNAVKMCSGNADTTVLDKSGYLDGVRLRNGVCGIGVDPRFTENEAYLKGYERGLKDCRDNQTGTDVGGGGQTVSDAKILAKCDAYLEVVALEIAVEKRLFAMLYRPKSSLTEAENKELGFDETLYKRMFRAKSHFDAGASAAVSSGANDPGARTGSNRIAYREGYECGLKIK